MAGFSKKNVEQVQRNGKPKESKVVVKYITQTGRDGVGGEDSFNVQLSPSNVTFKAGSYNATPDTYYSNVYVTRGANRINGKVLDSSITAAGGAALPAGLSVSVSSGTNGTLNTQLVITTTENLVADAGEIVIPVQYSLDAHDGSTNYVADDWDPETNVLVTYEAIYSWTLGKTGQSMYVLDLSNENASINADASGNIISGAMRPSCTAVLNFGASPVDGAKYSISYPSDYGVQGVSINQNTGVMTFNPGTASTPFSFGDHNDPNDTVLEITVDASYDGRVRGRKVMTITKALPGQSGVPGDPGEDAVSRWIELSANQVKIDASGNILPPKISAKKWKQVGGNNPIEDQSTNIRWTYDSSVISVNDPSTAYTGEITISSTWNYLTFKLYMGTTPLGETETVPILKDGKDGSTGQQGRRGAAIRGPVIWDSSTDVTMTDLRRWFYCGVQSTLNDLEGQYIDVILHDKQYYVCKNNYEQTNANKNWRDCSNNWTVADSSFNFVAANLILAQNAGIDFLTGNEIYLRDGSGNVTAGASGGPGISFWAGGEKDASANFVVNYDGTMTAKKGTFGCLSIGTDSAGASVLTGEGTYDGTTTELTLSPTYFIMDASSNKVIISPGGNPNANGIIHIDSSADRIDMWADGIVRAGSLETMTTTAAGNVLPSGSIYNTYASGGGAVITPGLFNVEIVFVTDSILLTTSGGPFDKTGSTWKFHGIDTRVSTSSYPNIGIYNNQNGKYHGHIEFYNSSSQMIISGIAYTVATRQPNVIYITL